MREIVPEIRPIVIEARKVRNGIGLYINVRFLEGLRFLRECFLELADKRAHLIRLHEQASVELRDLSEFDLRLGADSLSPFRPFHVEREPGEPIRVRWTESAECWLDCADLVQTLIESNRAGHQYLTSHGVEDISIVLSYLEI